MDIRHGWEVFIKGSALWLPFWQSKGSGIYWATPADSLFDDVPSDFLDSHNPFRTPLCVSPYKMLGTMENGGDKTLNDTLGQVFVNGEMYMEMGKKSLLIAGKKWCYDPETNRINVMFGSLTSTQQKVEITVRRRVLYQFRKQESTISPSKASSLNTAGTSIPTVFRSQDSSIT